MCVNIKFNLYNILLSINKYLINNVDSHGLSQLLTMN